MIIVVCFLLILVGIFLLKKPNKTSVSNGFIDELNSHERALYIKYSNQYPNSYWKLYEKRQITARQKKFLKESLLDFHKKVKYLEKSGYVEIWLGNEYLDFFNLKE